MVSWSRWRAPQAFSVFLRRSQAFSVNRAPLSHSQFPAVIQSRSLAGARPSLSQAFPAILSHSQSIARLSVVLNFSSSRRLVVPKSRSLVVSLHITKRLKVPTKAPPLTKEGLGRNVNVTAATSRLFKPHRSKDLDYNKKSQVLRLGLKRRLPTLPPK